MSISMMLLLSFVVATVVFIAYSYGWAKGFKQGWQIANKTIAANMLNKIEDGGDQVIITQKGSENEAISTIR